MFKNPYLEYLNENISKLNETEWTYLFEEHFKLTLYFYEKAQKSNPSFFRDCISRSNKLFEGIINLIYDLSSTKDATINTSEWRLARKIRTLLNKQFISPIFHSKLDDFRDGIRNPETHEIFRGFTANEAKGALDEALVFFNIGIQNYRAIQLNKVPLTDLDYLYMLIQSFIESFAIHSEIFRPYEVRYNGIYSDSQNNLLDLVKDYYDNSIFTTEFNLEAHQVVNRLKPSFKISKDSLEVSLILIKITEANLMYQTYIDKIVNRIESYGNTFPYVYYLIWSFTKRKKLLDILSLFEEIPSFHLYGLKDMQQKLITKYMVFK